MSQEPSETDLRAIRDAFGVHEGETMADRRGAERQARMRHDGRASRGRELYLELNVKVPPTVKARLVALCRRQDMRIKDFVLECLEAGLAKHGDDG